MHREFLPLPVAFSTVITLPTSGNVLCKALDRTSEGTVMLSAKISFSDVQEPARTMTHAVNCAIVSGQVRGRGSETFPELINPIRPHACSHGIRRRRERRRLRRWCKQAQDRSPPPATGASRGDGLLHGQDRGYSCSQSPKLSATPGRALLAGQDPGQADQLDGFQRSQAGAPEATGVNSQAFEASQPHVHLRTHIPCAGRGPPAKQGRGAPRNIDLGARAQGVLDRGDVDWSINNTETFSTQDVVDNSDRRHEISV